MKTDFELVQRDERAVEIHRRGGGLLLRYIHDPDTPLDEAPRPYAHPVRTLAGEVLTNFRPNDHRWHHALSFTINRVSGHNFWGGGSYRKADGYQWRNDQGTQRHVAWLEQRDDRLAHTLEWRTGAAGELLLHEQRALTFTLVSPQAWSLRWTATLNNVSGRALELGQYFSTEGLPGSHYTGLQFRGARDLLDEHGDGAIGISAEGGLSSETAVHGAAASWMEWRGQKDESQRRVTIRFTNNTGPLRWFVRRHNPLAALPFQFERNLPLAPGASFAVDHTLTFADA
jgi:hypothetical protein